VTVETIDTLVIGCGQAGVAMSEHLLTKGVPHIVVERHRIAERWRSERWDSLVANGPVWHDRFPGMLFPDIDQDAFAPKELVADYFEAYARMIGAPVRCGVEVNALERSKDGGGFCASTSAGPIEARNVVVATGPFQKPVMPALVKDEACVMQLHSNAYRNPGQLPPGAVLVVGAGSSGVQIADELQRAGRKVYLSVGPHNRPPRRYRGKDFVWWLGVLGKWDIKTPHPSMEHVTIAVSGAYGGRTVDFRSLAADGMVLLGRATSFRDGIMYFAADIAENIRRGDSDYLSVLDEADAYIALNGLNFPEEPGARIFGTDPDCVLNPVLTLNLSDAGISTILWATGYAYDFGWIKLDVFDEKGRPKHKDGVCVHPGLYFVGLPWLSRRASSFIWGAWTDAARIAAHVAGRKDGLT
jgi:putative flavoprotein involved in K+ transport